MERAYEKSITPKEELSMKYEAVKKLEDFGYIVKKDKEEEILIFADEVKIGKFIYSKEERAPIAVLENNFTNDLLQRTRMRVFKEILLDLGWAVSDNKILS